MAYVFNDILIEFLRELTKYAINCMDFALYTLDISKNTMGNLIWTSLLGNGYCGIRYLGMHFVDCTFLAD